MKNFLKVTLPERMHTLPLTTFYVVILSVLFVLILLTPFLVKEGISFLTEEHLEAILLGTLTCISFFIYRDYYKRIGILQERYHDLSLHVGSLNLQTVQIESMVKEITKLPKNKQDLRRTFEALNKNILSAVNVDWVLIRIIDNATGRTLTEQQTERELENSNELTTPDISNKLLLQKKGIPSLLVFDSVPENVGVTAFCILPQYTLNSYQEVVLHTAVNNLALVYLIFRSESSGQK